MLRIPSDQNFDEPLSAINGAVAGELFCVGMIHTSNQDGVFYIATSDGKILAEGNDLEAVAARVLQEAKVKLSLSAAEMEELQYVLLVQDDAEYDIDEEKWKFSIGSGGELALSDEFKGALIVNVTPFYNTEIKVTGAWGEADDDACSEDHEFCGALRG